MDKKIKNRLTFWMVLIVVVLLIGVVSVKAQSETDYDKLFPHVLGRWIPSGQYCVVDYTDGFPNTKCYDPICPVCETQSWPTPTPTPKSPDPTPKYTPTPEPEPKANCNSGRGNLSETDPANDCDPGNSGGHNQGGD